jgi:transcriptional regulator with XRE-family HTH domain
MTSFRAKLIENPPSLGQQLKTARQNLDLTPAEAAGKINISLKYLLALENGEYEKLPGEVYGRSFLRVYLKFLGLEQAGLFPLYQSEFKIYSKTRKVVLADFKQPVKRVSLFELLAAPKIARSLGVLILIFACLFYLGFKIKIIMTPPSLVVEKPIDNQITDQNFIEVTGTVEKEAVLEINGQQVIADQNGRFSEIMDLQPGINSIEFKAEKRHGKQTKIYRQVVLTTNSEKNN